MRPKRPFPARAVGPNVRRPLLTLAIAGAGTGAFHVLDLPLPFLFGPMAACLLAALAGVQLRAIKPAGIAARTVLGVAVGASITPAVVGQLPAMALSLTLVPLYVLVIALVGVPFFRRVSKLDPATAYYCAMPGGFQDMVLFGEEAGANVRVLSLVHATRVLTIVTIAPFVITSFYGVPFANPIGEPALSIPPHELALMVFAALVGWQAAARVGLFGATIIGPLILAAVLSLADLLHGRPPAEAILAAQFFIGMAIGVHYVGVTLAELRRVVATAALFVLVLAAIAAVFTEIVVLSGLAPPVDAFLAFVPGGQAEITVVAIIAGADLGYVVTHHLARIVLVITGAPIAARLMGAGKRPPPTT